MFCLFCFVFCVCCVLWGYTTHPEESRSFLWEIWSASSSLLFKSL
jgi:hypothetical protein